MSSPELEDTIESLKDTDLFKLAVKYLRIAFMEPGVPEDDPEEALDVIYMECARRHKEWIFDKAQEAFFKQSQFCPLREERISS